MCSQIHKLRNLDFRGFASKGFLIPVLSFWACIGHVILQQKLLSSPWFGAFGTKCATCCLLRRSIIFTDTGIKGRNSQVHREPPRDSESMLLGCGLGRANQRQAARILFCVGLCCCVFVSLFVCVCKLCVVLCICVVCVFVLLCLCVVLCDYVCIDLCYCFICYVMFALIIWDRARYVCNLHPLIRNPP